MHTPYSVLCGKDGREIMERGTPLFPCSVYQRDVRDYIAGEISLHWHRELECFLLESGTAHVTLSDAEFDLYPGDGYFVNSNVIHSVSCRMGESCRYRSIVFDSVILSGAPGSAFDTLYIRPFTEGGSPACILRRGTEYADSVIHYCNLAFDACKNKGEGYEFSVRNSLSQMILLLRKNIPEAPQRFTTQQELRMKQMILWFDGHYTEAVTIRQLAAAVGICVRECQKIFAARLHLSPMQYLMRRRIAAAVELLEASSLSISEIGMNCGFESPSYFASQFKKVMGISPGRYRKEYRASRS